MALQAVSTAIDTISKMAESAGEIMATSAANFKATLAAFAAISTDLISVSESLTSESTIIKDFAFDFLAQIAEQSATAMLEISNPRSSILIAAEAEFSSALSTAYLHVSVAEAAAQALDIDITDKITLFDLPEATDGKAIVAATKDLIAANKVMSSVCATSAAALKAVSSIATTATALYSIDQVWVATDVVKFEEESVVKDEEKEKAKDDEEDDADALFWKNQTDVVKDEGEEEADDQEEEADAEVEDVDADDEWYPEGYTRPNANSDTGSSDSQNCFDGEYPDTPSSDTGSADADESSERESDGDDWN